MSILLSVGLLVGSSVYPASACAQANPNLTVSLLSANPKGTKSWGDATAASAGDALQFYIELHNTVVGSTVNNTNVRVALPSDAATNFTVTSFASGSNHGVITDATTVNVQGGGTARLAYRAGSTRVTWDLNGDGSLDQNNSVWPNDGLVTTGINFGDLRGCNEFAMQLSFVADVVGVTAAPPPPPPPPPPPAPQGGVTQTQTQTQTVNVTTPAPPPAQAEAPKQPAAPVKRVLPATGPTREQVALATALLSALPVGWSLRRYARR